MSATIPIEGGERWEILLNGESTQGYDAGGPGPDGYVQAEAELDGETVMITVSTDGEGHTVSMSEDPFGEEVVDVDVDLADDQPERGSAWVVTEGEHEGAEIDLLPEDR